MYSGRQKQKTKSKRIQSFSIINPHAAGIDVGATEMVVAVNPEACDENVQTFGAARVKGLVGLLIVRSLNTHWTSNTS